MRHRNRRYCILLHAKLSASGNGTKIKKTDKSQVGWIGVNTVKSRKQVPLRKQIKAGKEIIGKFYASHPGIYVKVEEV